MNKLGFVEKMGGSTLKFVREGNYKHEISLDDEKLIYSNNKGDRKEYSIKDELEVQRAFKDINKIVEGME